jgi:hypothetical protein
MVRFSRSQQIILCIFFYLCACLLASAIITVGGDSALPVSVKLTGSSIKNLSAIDVYRLSINGGQKILTTKNYIETNSIILKEISPKIYFQAIRIKLSSEQLNTLTSITIKIGDKEFKSSKQELNNTWTLIDHQQNCRIYQSPVSIAATRSILPFWRKVINWGFNKNLVADIFIHKLPLLILLLVFLVLKFSIGKRLLEYMKNVMAKKDNWPLYTSIGLSLLITIYRQPYNPQPIEAGLDPSWIVGLNWAASNGLNWGSDLVFTYGPYYWLLYPDLLLSQSMLILALIATTTIFSYAIWVFIYFILRNVNEKKLSLSLALLGLLTLALFEYTLIDIAIVSAILLLSINNHRSYFASILPACLLLTLLSLCKFSYLAVSLCVLVFCSLQLIVKKEYRNLLVLILTFISVLYGLWFVSGQPISNLGLFISRGYEIAQGYPEAMATPIWNEMLSVQSNLMTNILLLGVGLSLLLGITVLFFGSVKQNTIWFELLLTAPVLFLAFKEGYIRMDPAHAALFFSQLQVVLIAYMIFYSEYKIEYVYMRSILAIMFIALLLVTDAHIPFNYTPELESTFYSDKRVKLIDHSKKYLRNTYSLTRDFYGKFTSEPTDIIPYDISLLYSYNLNWSPRPVFQSYSVYTSVLDSLNAKHYMQQPPEQLLFSFKSIDNRYPLFEEPSLLKQIINSYKIVDATSNTYLLLHLKPSYLKTIPSTRYQSLKKLSMNNTITVPMLPGYYTYLHAQIELTTLGKILNFILKIQPLFIDINLKGNNTPQRFRIIRNTIKDGLLVSSFAENFQMASVILSGEAKPNVNSIKFVGNTWLYKQDIVASFRFETILNKKNEL